MVIINGVVFKNRKCDCNQFFWYSPCEGAVLKYLLLCRLLDKKLYSTSSLSAKVPSVYAVVQFYPWFKDCFILIITPYHIQKQRKFKIKLEVNQG